MLCIIIIQSNDFTVIYYTVFFTVIISFKWVFEGIIFHGYFGDLQNFLPLYSIYAHTWWTRLWICKIKNRKYCLWAHLRNIIPSKKPHIRYGLDNKPHPSVQYRPSSRHGYQLMSDENLWQLNWFGNQMSTSFIPWEVTVPINRKLYEHNTER
jgi:hypothetical protein